jgi:uncharacterized phiE125 gp8 family phage protein
MTYKIVTAVATEPVTLAEARLQCKVDSDDTSHDALFDALITAAREFAEHYTGRAIGEQTLETALDWFPAEDFIDLPMPPVASITSVLYTDTAGDEQTFTGYTLSPYNARRINLTADAEWPQTQECAEAVRIRYVTGTVVPKAVKAAMLLHIELESPLNPHTPAERESKERARNALLDTVKVWD